jgi:tRNA pseudouridine synthase 10
VRTESGTYVKEFVHGDSGRTVPSLAGKLGIACTVEWLDVIRIADQS